MKSTLFILTVCVFFFNVTPVMSHHGRANFSFDDTVTVAGTVTYFRWRNPHVYMEVQATKENNEIETWLVETGSVITLKKMGWEEDLIETGDNVVVVGNPNRDPKKNHILLDHVIREDGETFYIAINNRTVGTVKVVPATSIASEDNLPSKDFSGTWTRGPNTQVTSEPFEPPEEGSWPLTELGEAQRVRFDYRDNPGYECAERGLPFYSLGPYAYSWKRYVDRIEITSQYSAYTRTLHLDETRHPDDLEPSLVGHSIAHIDEDGSLLVDTVGFPAGVKWGLAPGIYSSEQKRIIEHYTLNNGGMGMTITVTIEDPVYLTEPVIVNGTYRKVPDIEVTYECDLEAAQKDLFPPQKTP